MQALKNISAIDGLHAKVDAELRRWIGTLRNHIDNRLSGIDRGFDHLWSEISADKKLIEVLSGALSTAVHAASSTSIAAGSTEHYLNRVLAYLASGFALDDPRTRGEIPFVMRGVAGKIAIPHLKNQLLVEGDLSVRQAIATAIASVEDRDVAKLLKRLADGDTETRREAISQLRDGDDVKQVLPALEAAVADTDHVVRSAALGRLAHHIGDRSRRIALLVGGADDPHKSVRATATRLLYESDAPAETVLPVMRNALSDDDNLVRFIALSALKKERLGVGAVPMLVDALQDRRLHGDVAGLLRLYATDHQIALDRIPPELPRLVRRLSDSETPYPDHFVAADLAVVLGATDEPAVAGVLLAMARSERKELYEGALAGLSYMECPQATAVLVELLGAQSAGLRRLAAWHLGNRGDAGAVEAIGPLTDDADADVRAAAEAAIEKIHLSTTAKGDTVMDNMPPYQSFQLEEVEIAFAGNFQHGDRDDYEYLAEYCNAEIAGDVTDAGLVVLGANADEAKAQAGAAGAETLTEAQFLNLVDFTPEIFSTFVDGLVGRDFDITTLSNEGDGYCETIDWQVPGGVADVHEALTGYARMSPAITKEMADMAKKIRYGERQLSGRLEDYTMLVEGDEARGWMTFEKPDFFGWSIRAYNEDTIVSGVSLLKTLATCVDDIAVLAVADQPIEDNISTMYLCGGIDSRGHLVGFVIKQILT